MKRQRLVTVAPDIRRPTTLIEDQRRDVQLLQRRPKRQSAMTCADDHAIGLARDAELLRVLRTDWPGRHDPLLSFSQCRMHSI